MKKKIKTVGQVWISNETHCTHIGKAHDAIVNGTDREQRSLAKINTMRVITADSAKSVNRPTRVTKWPQSPRHTLSESSVVGPVIFIDRYYYYDRCYAKLISCYRAYHSFTERPDRIITRLTTIYLYKTATLYANLQLFILICIPFKFFFFFTTF